MTGPAEHRLSRRAFLGRAAGGAAAIAGAVVIGSHLRDRPGPSLWDSAAFPRPGEARVAVLTAASYESDLTAVVRDGLLSIGADLQGAKVLLKPNFVEFDTGSVINTDPRLVAATVLAVRRMGASSVTVGEGPGHRRDTGYVVNSSGLSEALASVEVPFVDLNTADATSVRLSSRYTQLGEIWLPRAVTEADVVISMPKMKTHHWAGVTLSLKNCFGCLPGRVYGWPKNILHWMGIETRSSTSLGRSVPPTRSSTGSSGWRETVRSMVRRSPQGSGLRRRPRGDRHDRVHPDGDGSDEDPVPSRGCALPRTRGSHAYRASR